MTYFSAKELLLGAAGVIWLCVLFWCFLISDGHVSEILVNLVTDIPFAFFIVLLVDYVNRREREALNRSRRRMVARAVQSFYIRILGIYAEIIRDGVLASREKSLPNHAIVVAKAEELRSKTLLHKEKDDQPVPYAAYFITHYTGTSDANVFPPRSVRSYLAESFIRVVSAYKEVYQIEGGDLPDAVVDAMSQLRTTALVLFSSDNGLGGHSIKIGYWSEEEIDSVLALLGILSSYFSPIVGAKETPEREFFINVINNALAENSA